MALLKTGTAIVVITTPNTTSIVISVMIAVGPAPRTMTSLRACEAYVSGRTFDMSCMYHGICCMGKNTPLRNIIGNISVIIIIIAVS